VGKAEEDYAAARDLSRKRKSPLPGINCFHCQQCAEKYLKGRLAEAGISLPHTHDLVALLKLVQPAEPLLASLRENVDGLTHYAVDSRYPRGCEMLRLGQTRRVSCGECCTRLHQAATIQKSKPSLV
jgi:HEPN domain-containing protein